MSKKIKVTAYLDGAPKFNSDVKSCNASLKLFQSELKKNQVEFKGAENSLDALSKKSETLQKIYDTSAKKVETYAKRLEELNKTRDEEEKTLSSYQEKLDLEKKKLSDLESIYGKNSDAVRQQTQVVDQLQAKVDASQSALSRWNEEEVRLNTAVNNATAEQIKYGAELENTNRYLSEAQVSTDKCAKSIDAFGREADGASGHIEKIDKTLEEIAKNEAFAKLGEASKKLLENLMECAETAEEFEYSIAKVQSIAQVSGGELRDMSSEIRRVATEMGYGANEIAEATYQAISASVDAADAVGFVEDTTRLARAGFTEVTTAIDVQTTAINAYGKEANTTAHIADDLITTQNLGKTTVDELAQSLGTIIPTAAAYSVSLDQLSSSYVILTKQGINTANATTYLNGMLNELGDSGSDVSQILYNLTGHTFGELMKQGYSLGDVMDILSQSVDGNSESFANLFSNVRAGKGALAIANQGAEEFNDTLSAMQNNAGATDKAFNTMADTAVMVNQRFESSVENLKIAIGETLSPTLAAVKETGIDLLEKITEIVEENPALVAALAGAAAAATATAVAVTGLATAVALLRLAFGDARAIVALVAIGAAGAAGAIAGAGIAAANAADETKEYAKTLRESAEAGHEAAVSANEEIESQKKKEQYVSSLVERIKNLNAQESLTKAQQYDLKTSVQDLNNTIGDTVIQLDAETGRLTDNSEEWIKNAQAQEEAAKTAALHEKLNEVLQERSDVNYQVWETTQRINDIEGRRAQIEEEVIEIQNLGADADQDQMNRLRELYNEADTLKEKEIELKQSRNELINTSQELTESYGNLNAYIKETAEAEGEAAGQAAGFADQLNVMHDSAEAAEEANKAIAAAIEQASGAIGEQIGLFDEWRTQSELTFEQMQKRWQEQNGGIEQYRDDLTYLKGVIDSDVDPAIKDLATEMVNMGVDGAAELHEFTEGLKSIGDNGDAMKDLADTWNDHISTIKDAEDIYASITLQEQGYVDDSTALFTQYYADSETAQQEYNSAMQQAAGQGVTDQANAIKSNSQEVITATGNMAEGAVDAANSKLGIQRGGGTSTVFYQMGKTIDDSLAKGIEDNDSVISQAMQTALNRAVNNMDTSGIVAQINRKLGEAFS